MRIVRRLIYVFFVLLIFMTFVFFGGGRTLIRIGEKMQKWELSLKKRLGIFCKESEKKIKVEAGKVKDKFGSRTKADR